MSLLTKFAKSFSNFLAFAPLKGCSCCVTLVCVTRLWKAIYPSWCLAL